MGMIFNSFIQVLVISLAGFYSSNDTADIHFANHTWPCFYNLFEDHSNYKSEEYLNLVTSTFAFWIPLEYDLNEIKVWCTFS